MEGKVVSDRGQGMIRNRAGHFVPQQSIREPDPVRGKGVELRQGSKEGSDPEGIWLTSCGAKKRRIDCR